VYYEKRFFIYLRNASLAIAYL